MQRFCQNSGSVTEMADTVREGYTPAPGDPVRPPVLPTALCAVVTGKDEP